MLHRNTTLYRRAMELITLSATTIGNFPKGYAFLADQVRRSSSSIALNYAEGSGKASQAERRRYFRIAKASALETAAAFDVALHFGAISTATNDRAQDLCDHIAALLHRCQ
jgi:four helix bundle protein